MQLNFENSQFFTTIPTSAGMPFDLDIALLSAADRSRIWLELEKILRFDMLSRIPSEVALRIFTLLDARSLCRASQVSRNWHRLADDDLLWHRLCQQHIEKVLFFIIQFRLQLI
jgi:hypothetical protein